VADSKKGSEKKYYIEKEEPSMAADPVVAYLDVEQLGKLLDQTRKKMEKAAKELDFMEAARLRDDMLELENMLKEKSASS
jgi:excinuclease ABC subunit B